MNCQDSRHLIPSYLDGELSEAQAAPLRQHLMDCQACRKAASGQKALSRWFRAEPAADVQVPAGFAARVARLAFAGAAPTNADDDAAAGRLVGAGERSLQSTILWLTAAAAAALLVVSGMLAQLPRGESVNLRAGQHESLEEILEELDALADPAGGSSESALEDMSRPGRDEAAPVEGPERR